MPLTADNVATILNLLTALTQRQQMVQQLAGHFQAGTLWRSPDGKLAISITDQQNAEIAELVKAYLDESELVIISARAMLDAPPR